MQEIGPSQFWVSEVVFAALFVWVVIWLLSPFVTEKKSFYTVVVVKRILVHICCAIPLCACSLLPCHRDGSVHVFVHPERMGAVTPCLFPHENVFSGLYLPVPARLARWSSLHQRDAPTSVQAGLI